MKKIYLVRHGETNYNEAGLVQGSDSVLTDAGIKQVNRLATRVESIAFDHLLVSDYERTRQTAQPIVDLTSKEAEFTPLVREVRRPSEFIHKPNQSDEYQAFLHAAKAHYSDAAWHHSDEENFFDAKQRVKETLDYIASLNGDVLVVSHGHFIRLMVSYILTQGNLTADMWQMMEHSYKALNTGITTILSDDDHYQLLTFNDIAHFAE